ncbi:MAG: hypothetical protein IJR10_00280 [Clostridia bacterium]|nr:hypothetical protein [Clostridia bacterium]
MNDETPSGFLNTINEVYGKIMVSVCGFVDALCEGSVKQEYAESLNDKMIVLRLSNINRMLETNNVCGNKMYASTASAPLFNSSMKT